METRRKSHGDEVIDFYKKKKVPGLDSNHNCLAVISFNSALKKENYYPQVFLKEFKYIEKEVVRHIHLMSLMKNKLEWVNFFCNSIAS